MHEKKTFLDYSIIIRIFLSNILFSSEHAPMRTQSARVVNSPKPPVIEMTVHQTPVSASPRAKRRNTTQNSTKPKFPEFQFVVGPNSPRASPRVQRRDRPSSMDYTRPTIQPHFHQHRHQHNRPHQQRHQNRPQTR